MAKARWIALAGPLTILAGLIWLVAALGELVLRTGLIQSESSWDSVLHFWSYAFFLTPVLLLFALIGTRVRFHRSAGVPGRLGLALSLAGCAGMIVSFLAFGLSTWAPPEVEQITWVNYTAWVGFLSLLIGYTLFGVDALRYRLLPRWNVLPLLLGLTVVFSFTHDMFGVPALLPSLSVIPFLQFALTGTCWLLLGVTMMDQRRGPQPGAGLAKEASSPRFGKGDRLSGQTRSRRLMFLWGLPHDAARAFKSIGRRT